MRDLRGAATADQIVVASKEVFEQALTRGEGGDQGW